MEGRKVWSRLNGISANLARNIWCHAKEREGEFAKKDLQAKISFCNLIVAFAIALKHKVRFELYTQYEDLHDLVAHLDTFAKAAGKPTGKSNCHVTLLHIKHLLRLAESNPRAGLKRAKRPLGLWSYCTTWKHTYKGYRQWNIPIIFHTRKSSSQYGIPG
jgi:putative membrane protein